LHKATQLTLPTSCVRRQFHIINVVLLIRLCNVVSFYLLIFYQRGTHGTSTETMFWIYSTQYCVTLAFTSNYIFCKLHLNKLHNKQKRDKGRLRATENKISENMSYNFNLSLVNCEFYFKKWFLLLLCITTHYFLIVIYATSE
jgi:hypothetical protein